VRGITDRQLEVLRHIHNYCQQHGYPPAVRDLMDLCKVSSVQGVNVHIKPLEKKGYLSRATGVARSLAVTPAGLSALGISETARLGVDILPGACQCRQAVVRIFGKNIDHQTAIGKEENARYLRRLQNTLLEAMAMAEVTL
jgi:SOS-response transcriptional repressor LexA